MDGNKICLTKKGYEIIIEDERDVKSELGFIK